MRINSRGQVTIPKGVREAAALLPGTEVNFAVEGSRVLIVKAHNVWRPGRGTEMIEHLRRNAGQLSMTTDGIMAMTRGE